MSYFSTSVLFYTLYCPHFVFSKLFLHYIYIFITYNLIFFGFSPSFYHPFIFLLNLFFILSILSFPFSLTLLYFNASIFPIGVPVFLMYSLWHHSVPSAARPRHRSGIGCLGYKLFVQEAQQANPFSKPRLLQGNKDSLSGLCYHPNLPPCLAHLGCYWLQPSSRALFGSALRGLQLERVDVTVTTALSAPPSFCPGSSPFCCIYVM